MSTTELPSASPVRGRSRRAWGATSPRRSPRHVTSTGSGARLPGSTWSGSVSNRRSRIWSGPRCSSRRSLRRASRSSRRCAPAGSSRTSSSVTRSGSSPRWPRSARWGRGEAIGLVRERGLAMAEAARLRPGSMAAILGLEDEQVETLCQEDPRGLAGELQLSGADRRLRRGRGRGGVLRRGREPRRTTSDPAEGLRRVPLAAGGAGGGPV